MAHFDRSARRRHLPLLAVLPLVGAAGCEPAPPPIAVGPVEFSAPAGSLAPNLAADGDRAVLSWLEPTADGRHALRTAVREGGVWGAPRTVIDTDSLWVNWADIPSVLPLAGGTWLAHWPHRVGPGTYAYHVRVARSADGGATWEPSVPPHGDRSETEHGFVSLVPWDDAAAAVWLDGRRTADEGPMTLRFTTITDGLPAPDQPVDEQVCDCCQTSMARTASGLVVAYRDREPGEIRDVAVRRYDGGQWSEPVKVADDGWHYPGCPVNGPSVAARGDTVVVAWFTAADNTPRVYTAFSTDGGATFAPPIQTDDGRPAGRVDVVWWGPRTLVSWIEESDTAGAVRVREIGPRGTAAASTLVAATTASRQAGFPQLVTVGDEVIVAWTEPGAGVRATVLTRGP